MVWQLPIVEIEGKKYFDDARLQEYRNVKDFMDRILYHDLADRKVTLLQPRVDLLESKTESNRKRNHL